MNESGCCGCCGLSPDRRNCCGCFCGPDGVCCCPSCVCAGGVGAGDGVTALSVLAQAVFPEPDPVE